MLSDQTSVITLSLLHPGKMESAQSWTFEEQPLIRIGRAADNHVVLYSAVVSRHHLEIRRTGSDWELVNLGANGTYINGSPVDNCLAVDGMIVRLASSGPKILIHLSPQELPLQQQRLNAHSHTQSIPETTDQSNSHKETIV